MAHLQNSWVFPSKDSIAIKTFAYSVIYRISNEITIFNNVISIQKFQIKDHLPKEFKMYPFSKYYF